MDEALDKSTTTGWKPPPLFVDYLSRYNAFLMQALLEELEANGQFSCGPANGVLSGPAQLPQIFRGGPHRAHPTAKRFAEDD
jgi:hypothetical protein